MIPSSPHTLAALWLCNSPNSFFFFSFPLLSPSMIQSNLMGEKHSLVPFSPPTLMTAASSYRQHQEKEWEGRGDLRRSRFIAVTHKVVALFPSLLSPGRCCVATPLLGYLTLTFLDIYCSVLILSTRPALWSLHSKVSFMPLFTLCVCLCVFLASSLVPRHMSVFIL